jgi:KipI family sensor histidine kinase inhibitor
VTRVRAAGDAALLVEAGQASGAHQDGNGAATLAALIRAADLPGMIDVVPAAATVLVSVEPGSWDLAELAARLSALAATAAARPAGADPGAATIEVCYDGPDLADVAALTRLTVAEVIARHQAAEYRVGWLGFAPGFAYLTGLAPQLAAVPRLDSPRQLVPAGSVAIAGGLAAVYPAASPGGWRLLGRTVAPLWEPDRDPPALLVPGMRVRFRAVDSLPPLSDQTRADRPAPDLAAAAPAAATTDAGRRVEVLQPGLLTTVQDLGRAGLGHLGVPASGAADPGSLRLANSLVGNEPGAACLEVTLGRLALRFESDAVVAVTGAPAPVRVDDAEFFPGAAVAVGAGSVLRLGAPAAGLRSYVAIDGGFDVRPVLGSRSADGLSGLGPRPLRPGDWLPVGRPRSRQKEDRQTRLRTAGPAAGPPPANTVQAGTVQASTVQAGTVQAGTVQAGTVQAGTVQAGTVQASTVELRAIAGPRDDWFGAAALEALAGANYVVSPASNRTGLRLTGPPLRRVRTRELPSEGMAAGSLQVTHDGQPILLLADRPTTGGYPVIAVIAAADLGLAGQLRPGQQVRFRVSQGLAWPAPTASAG